MNRLTTSRGSSRMPTSTPGRTPGASGTAYANGYGLTAYLARKPMLAQGMVLDRTVIVQDGTDRRVVLRRLCHEVAEALLALETHAELRRPASGNAHQVARLVEQRYVEYLVFVRAAEESTRRRREARRQLRELIGGQTWTRERDDYCDAPFEDG